MTSVVMIAFIQCLPYVDDVLVYVFIVSLEIAIRLRVARRIRSRCFRGSHVSLCRLICIVRAKLQLVPPALSWLFA